MTGLLLGIDPGFAGALAFLGVDGILHVADMPVLEIVRGGKTKHEINLTALAGEIATRRPAHAVLERVGAMPGQGVTSMFAFGRGVGQIEGVIAALGVPVSYVTPAQWKKDLQVPAGKDAARLRASQLMPAYAERWRLKKHDGRAEAALIALWGLTRLRALAGATLA